MSRRVYPSMSTPANTGAAPVNPTTFTPNYGAPTQPITPAPGIAATAPTFPAVGVGAVPPTNAQMAPQAYTPTVGGGQFQTQPQRQHPSHIVPCPPELCQTTAKMFPATLEAERGCSLPMGCIVTPLARTAQNLPMVDFGAIGVIRCRRCRAYINPYVRFVEMGRRWTCSFCSFLNEVKDAYVCGLDANGYRTDVTTRPELTHCAVEFLAPQDYMVRPPMPSVYFFVIDVSYPVVAAGLLKGIAKAIEGLLDDLPGGDRTKIGFITFDAAVHLYSFKEGASLPEMFVVAENPKEAFVPGTMETLLTDLRTSMPQVRALLERLPKMFAQTQGVHACLGSALKTAVQVVKHMGGKITFFSSSTPISGLGALKKRYDPKLLGQDKEINMMKPQGDFYTALAEECIGCQVGFDGCFFSSKPLDVPTIGTLCTITGGQIAYYPEYLPARHLEKLCKELRHTLTRQTAWEAVMRVRASKNVKINRYFGNFFLRHKDLLSLPVTDADKGFGVQLAPTKDFDKPYVLIQTALLYTSTQGDRRIRSLTVCMPSSKSPRQILESGNLIPIVSLMGKMAIDKALESNLRVAREAIVNKCVAIMKQYKTLLGNSGVGAQMLPPALSLLPLYVLGLIKSPVFRSGSMGVTPDFRAAVCCLFKSSSIELATAMMYPRLYSIHNLAPEMGQVDPNTGRTTMPAILGLSSARIDRTGIYLLDNGINIIVWIGGQAMGDVVNSLFGVSSLQNVDLSKLSLVPSKDTTSLSERVRCIIGDIRRNRPYFQQLLIFSQGQPSDQYFFSHFVEDRQQKTFSYPEFIQMCQKNANK